MAKHPARRRRRPGRAHSPAHVRAVLRLNTAWQLKYDELLSQAREAHDQHLEERVRLQAALASAVNARLTETNFIQSLQALERAVGIISKVVARVDALEDSLLRGEGK